jgi:hypothetical protein
MAEIATKSLPVLSHYKVHDKIRKFAQHLPLRQKSVVLRASKMLAELSPSERHAALDIIRQWNNNGELDYPWLASFLAVLGKLKAEENQSEPK